MLLFGDYNKKQTVRPLKSAQPVFFFVQCCHNVGRSPSFAFVLWIHDGGYGTLVDRILTLWDRQKDKQTDYFISPFGRFRQGN